MRSRPQGGPPRRPHIGITPDLSARAGYDLFELKRPYADAVLRAGGLPWILPFTEDGGLLDAYLDRISGLLVTGGAFDIPPEMYGEKAREGLGEVKLSRTAFEAALTRAALARDLPVLGICGGMQLLNVLLGGTLVQDIGREVPDAREHEQKHDKSQPHHPIEVKEGTLLAECLGRGPVMVNSTHHQAVKRAGESLVVSAVAPDGVVEAIECKTHTFAVGVQWHPEMLLDTVPAHLGIYRAFVQRAKEARGRAGTPAPALKAFGD
jgi:putative glutamine amidotransferase